MPKPLCVHCKQRQACASRGLCRWCCDRAAIRNLYPVKRDTYKRHPGETMEDLDRLVAQQYAALPDWWWDAMPKGGTLETDD